MRVIAEVSASKYLFLMFLLLHLSTKCYYFTSNIVRYLFSGSEPWEERNDGHEYFPDLSVTPPPSDDESDAYYPLHKLLMLSPCRATAVGSGEIFSVGKLRTRGEEGNAGEQQANEEIKILRY